MPIVRVPVVRVRAAGGVAAERKVPEEVPVALVYDGTTHAVMLATPADLEDFAVGFSLSEGKVSTAADIAELEIVTHGGGVEARMWLAPAAGAAVVSRRRAMLGPTGCGLCGIDSLEAALPPVRAVPEGPRVTAAQVSAAVAAMRPAQIWNREAHALHAAGFWTPADGLVAIREDIGRHNALDKLVGRLARSGRSAGDGILVLTSRVSVELVQKAATLGAPVLVAVSAPTALALRTAAEAGITVVGVARDDGFEVFTGPERVVLEAEVARV